MNNGMAYLAIPYTGKYGKNCPIYRLELSYQLVNAVAAYLIDNGELVYSPITHSHPLDRFMKKNGLNHDFWLRYDERMMEMCNRLYVVATQDWKQSRGVRHEIDWFVARKLPVWLLYIATETGEIRKQKYSVAVNGKSVRQLTFFDDDVVMIH
jgi:hypothetical protein